MTGDDAISRKNRLQVLLGARPDLAAAAAAVHAGAAAGGPAPSTVERRTRSWLGFSRWADQQAQRSLPADPLLVADWVAARYDAGIAPDTIRLDLEAIDVAHRDAGCVSPTHDHVVQQVLEGARIAGRERGSGPAVPLLHDELIPVLLRRPIPTAAGSRARAAWLLAHRAQRPLRQICELRREDVELTAEGAPTAVTLPAIQPEGRWPGLPRIVVELPNDDDPHLDSADAVAALLATTTTRTPFCERRGRIIAATGGEAAREPAAVAAKRLQAHLRAVARTAGVAVPARPCLTTGLQARDVADISRRCDRGWLIDLRDRTLLAIGWAAALRGGELGRLPRSDVSLVLGDDHRIWLRVHVPAAITKTGRSRTAHLPPDAIPGVDVVRLWEQWAAASRSTAPGAKAFPAMQGRSATVTTPLIGLTTQAVSIIVARHVGAAYSSHSLRRGRATTTLDTSGDLDLARQLLGHANVATTAGYDGRHVLGRGATEAMALVLASGSPHRA